MNRNNMNEYYAIAFADKVHDLLDTVQIEIDTMEHELNQRGFMVSWNLSSTGKYTDCFVDSEHTSIRTQAVLSDNDEDVKLLGKYISLARAYNVIVNQYEGEYKDE